MISQKSQILPTVWKRWGLSSGGRLVVVASTAGIPYTVVSVLGR